MSGQPRRLLGDIIAEKQAQNKAEGNHWIQSNFDKVKFCFLAGSDLDPRISSMYEQVGEILARYRSGKIPKAFKILPNLANWEQVLLITQPDRWTAASMYQATRLFASNMDAKMAQR